VLFSPNGPQVAEPGITFSQAEAERHVALRVRRHVLRVVAGHVVDGQEAGPVATRLRRGRLPTTPEGEDYDCILYFFNASCACLSSSFFSFESGTIEIASIAIFTSAFPRCGTSSFFGP
jgi:hypothetical protein